MKRIALSLVAAMAVLALQAATKYSHYYQDLPCAVEEVQEVVIPDYTVTLTDFGAVGDGKTDCSEAFAAALKHLHNLSFRPPVLTGREHQYLHEVSVQRVAEVALADEDVFVVALLQHPRRTGVLHLQPSGHIVAAGGLLVHVLAVQPVFASSALEQDFCLDKFVNNALHLLASLFVVNMDFGGYLFVIQLFIAC